MGLFNQTMGFRNTNYTPNPAVDPVPEGLPYERTCSRYAKDLTTFLIATYDMVSDASMDDAVTWSPAGSTFIVKSPEKVEANHRWEFGHDYFVRGHPEILSSIKRKSTRKYNKKSSSKTSSSNATTTSTTNHSLP